MDSLLELRRGVRNLDGELDRFAGLCEELVRLDARPLVDLRQSVERFVTALEEHVNGVTRAGFGPADEEAWHPGEGWLTSDHERFRASIQELRGLVDLLDRDDHGGHRQALGQYGRLVVESLRRHRVDERMHALERRPPAPAGKHK